MPKVKSRAKKASKKSAKNKSKPVSKTVRSKKSTKNLKRKEHNNKKKSKSKKKSMSKKKSKRKETRRKNKSKNKTRNTTTKSKKAQKGGDVTDTPTSKNRHFKVMDDNNVVFGRFSGSKPKQAANKALTSILRKRQRDKKNTEGEIRFSIVECTRGSKRKQYNYIGKRIELDDPVTVTIKGKEVTYKYSNNVRKDKN